MSQSMPYKVTAIVSVYKAEEFLRGCLEDLVAQSIFASTQVIIIDSCSPENEKAIALEFTHKYPNMYYLRTDERETLYAAWNRGIALAKGQYITNANADDRHAPHAFERMAKELDAHPEAALVYARYRITAQKNAHFDTAPIKRHLQWFEYDHLNLLRRTEVGPQPMWRKSVHITLGLFNPHYTVAGDYDLWLRISERYPFRFLTEELGLCLEYDNNLEAQNKQRSFDECYEVKKAGLLRFMQGDFTPHKPLRLQMHRASSQLSKALERIHNGEKIDDLSKLELQFFSYILLTAQVGNMQVALDSIKIFYSLITDAENISHLYRFLLLSSSPQTPGVLQIQPALLTAEAKPVPPVVSLILPIQEACLYLDELIASLRAQSLREWELYLVPYSMEEDAWLKIQALVQSYDDPRIKSLANTSTTSLAELYNTTVAQSSAPYVALLSPKDMLKPSYLHEAVATLQTQQDAHWVSPKTLRFGKVNRLAWEKPYDLTKALLHCPCATATVFRRSLWQELQGHDTRCKHAPEWDFWLRALEHGYTGLYTEDVEFLQRELFHAERDTMLTDMLSKREVMQLHPWWYKDFDTQQMHHILESSPLSPLPEWALHEEHIQQAKNLLKNTKAFVNFVSQWHQKYSL